MVNDGGAAASMRSESREGARKRARLWPVVVCVFLSVAAYGLFLRHGLAPAVVGYNLVPAERVMEGETPYRDFLYNYTPGLLWLNAALFKMAGATLMTARAGVLAAKVLTALLIFQLTRRFLSGWFALAPVVMTLAWIGYADILKVFPTQYGMPLLLASCFTVLRSQTAGSTRTKVLWLILSGALAGLTFIFKQNVGIFTLLAAATSVAYAVMTGSKEQSPDRRSARILQYIAAVGAGFTLAVAPMLAYLAARSALGPMISHFSRHAAEYGEAKGIALPSPLLLVPSALVAGFLVALGWVIRLKKPAAATGLVVGGCVALAVVVLAGDSGPTALLYRSLLAHAFYLPVYLGGAALLRAVIELKSTAGAEPRVRSSVDVGHDWVPLTLFAVAAFLEVFPRSDADHLVRVLPPSFVAASALLVTARAGRRSAGQVPVGVLIGFVLLTVLGLRVSWAPQFDAGLRFRENYPLEFERGRGVSGAPGEATRLNQVVAFVQANTEPGEPILSLARKMTSVYFFADRPNVTRLLWLDSAGISEEEVKFVEESIRERRFGLILVGGELMPDGTAVDGQDPSVEGALSVARHGYKTVSVIEAVTVLARRE